MAQMQGDSFNRGSQALPYGGGRAPARPKAKKPVNDYLRPNASSMNKYRVPVPIPAPKVGAPPNYGKSRTGQVRPTSSGSYGGGGGGYRTTSRGVGGGGGGGTSTKAAAVAKPPKPPSEAQYLLADAPYITQQSALARALADFQKQQGTAKTQYQGQYDLNLGDLTKQRTSGIADLQNDYASRGMLQSGVYGTAYSDLENEYKNRQTALDTARTNFLANLGNEATNFAGEQRDVLERAKQEAYARRLAKYNL